MLFVDSFSDGFSPEVAEAAVTVLERAGYTVLLPQTRVCCGLTWITTGQLDTAKRILGRTITEFARATEAGVPIVGLEPSCTAVLRSDAVDLLGTEAAAAVARNTHTLAEFLSSSPSWQPPDLHGTKVIAQPHCHHHGVMGWAADRKLLTDAGAVVQELGGCCGLAGNFGMEAGHYEISVAVAGQNLLPALDADPSAVVLADGFSCRTQIADLRDRPSFALAQLLAGESDAIRTSRRQIATEAPDQQAEVRAGRG